ncbi:MAG TPA: hypothetical protein VLT47_03015 [Anaeromyxobacteraceae bacterium]|nr:hypothetical protein [Anaeromyxobacteraceae bacterium]
MVVVVVVDAVLVLLLVTGDPIIGEAHIAGGSSFDARRTDPAKMCFVAAVRPFTLKNCPTVMLAPPRPYFTTRSPAAS